MAQSWQHGITSWIQSSLLFFLPLQPLKVPVCLGNVGQVKVGKKWWWICCDFPFKLTSLRLKLRALEDLCPCSAAWLMHLALPGPAIVPSQGGEAGCTPFLLVLTPSFCLTSVTLIPGHVQSEATITFGFFWVEKPHYVGFLLF